MWVNLLGPDPEMLTTLINEFAKKVATVQGIADLETSEKAAAPALSIRLNNDAAADVGINVQQVGATIRPLLAGDTVSYWLGPDGQNYEVNVQLPKDSRRLAADLSNLYLSTTKKGPDGEARMVPLRQVAEIVETTSPQIIKRQELQRRVALYANVEGRPVRRRQQGRAEDHQGDRRCRRATASTSAGRRRTWRNRSRRRSRRSASR